MRLAAILLRELGSMLSYTAGAFGALLLLEVEPTWGMVALLVVGGFSASLVHGLLERRP